MTPKERLKLLRDNFVQWSQFGLEHFDELEVALTELEELKRDVKRYFELEQTHCELHEIDEYYDLYEKLSKVGNEE